MNETGEVVYLIHFLKPLRHCQHYLGRTANLEARLARHRAGNGARIMAALRREGIDWILVRTWEGGRELEKQLKKQHDNPGLCPLCRGS